jgi:hypothetical protein
MKTSTIQHATGDGTWQSAYGLMYAYELRMANGDHFKVNSKKADAFTNGQQINYKLTGKTDRNGTPQGKIVSEYMQQVAPAPFNGQVLTMAQAPANNAGGKDRSILIQVAFKMAMERLNSDPTKTLQEVYLVAKYLYDEMVTAHEQF